VEELRKGYGDFGVAAGGSGIAFHESSIDLFPPGNILLLVL